MVSFIERAIDELKEDFSDLGVDWAMDTHQPVPEDFFIKNLQNTITTLNYITDKVEALKRFMMTLLKEESDARH